MKRRSFLKGTVASGMLGVAATAGLLTPKMVLAAWPKAAFEAKDLNQGMELIMGSSDTTESNKIKVKAPDIAENGAVVPITISTSLPDVSQMAVFIAKNPVPLCSSYDLGPTTMGFVSCRVKMGKTSDLIAVVKSGGKLYSAKKAVKVTIGGCGG